MLLPQPGGIQDRIAKVVSTHGPIKTNQIRALLLDLGEDSVSNALMKLVRNGVVDHSGVRGTEYRLNPDARGYYGGDDPAPVTAKLEIVQPRTPSEFRPLKGYEMSMRARVRPVTGEWI